MDITEFPEGITNSKYLSAEDKAIIKSCGRMPTEKELFEMGPVEEMIEIIENYGHDFNLFEEAMHQLAKQEIVNDNVWFAFKLLMVVEYSREKHNNNRQ